uniref:TlpA family protein disulfide reductase n=1 Tax=Schlesneria paludicola TaxID=360056 RepID=A0A7C2JX58_9PLAN
MPITEDPTSVPPTTSRGSFLIMAMAAVALAAMILSTFFRQPEGVPHGFQGDSRIGLKLPPLKAQGWLNGVAPTADELSGEVLLINIWAFWCRPCRALSPELVRLHNEYASRGVRFIGLTRMDSSTLENSRQFLKDEGITWLQGYGADAPLQALQVDAIPEVWVVGRDGRIAWDPTSRESIRKVLDRLLAE